MRLSNTQTPSVPVTHDLKDFEPWHNVFLVGRLYIISCRKEEKNKNKYHLSFTINLFIVYQNKFCYNGVFYCYYVTKTECQGCYYKLPGPKSCDGCTEIIWLVQSEVEKPRNNSSSNHELLWSPAGEEKEEQCLGPQCGEQNRPRIWEVLNIHLLLNTAHLS